MMPPDPPSLTPEERELAQRLARLGPHGEPSPVLDARILAAAHATIASTPARLPRRWPMALGLAASLVLAVGIAWRLRPLPETRPAYRSEAVSAVRMVSPPPAPAKSASDVDTLSAPTAEASDADATAVAKPQVAEPARRQPAERNAMPVVAQSAVPEPTVAIDVAAPQAASKAARVAAPPPVLAAPQAFGTPAPTAATPATRGTTSDASTGSDARQAHEAAAEANQAGMAQDATAARSDEPLNDVPPATADSPAVRDAWLQRIRDLVDSGNVDDARASLHEFTRRYAAYPLPADLRALER